MTSTIELKGMHFHAKHGCFPQERRDGGEYIVDFECNLPNIEKIAGSDSLADTLDYGAIYEIVSRQMQTPCNLIETVAYRIVEDIRGAYPKLEHFSIKISKLTLPIDGRVQNSAIRIEV